MSYKYSLDPSSKKYNCPGCSHKTFVVYIDTTDGSIVDEYEFGRCDRENNCGYHKHPNTDPEHADAAKAEGYEPLPTTVVEQIFPDEKIWGPVVHRTKTCISPLHVFLSKTLQIPNEHFIKWGLLSDSDASGNNLTVYIFRNQAGAIVNLKWFKYKDDGHRDKAFESFSLRQPTSSPPRTPQKQKLGEISERKQAPAVQKKYILCLFGEHLLDSEKKKPVCVVESEKTAVIASFFYPAFDWVACGSNNGLTDGKDGKPDKISMLKGRTVYWLCDADKASRMRTENGQVRPSSVRHLIENIDAFHIADLFVDRNDGYDIGDAIVDGLRPEILPTWTKGKDQLVQPPVTVENSDQFDYDLPDGVDFETVKWDIRKYMHFEHKGRVYVVRKRKDNDTRGIASFYCQDITNFSIRSLGLIDSESEPRRLIEIKNIHGSVRVLQVPTSAFASPTEFTSIIESEGNFQWDGIGNDLKKIRAKLYDTMDSFEEVESLGWYNGYFLFANGAYNGKFSPVDKYGFVKLGEKRFYIEALSAITREDSEDWEDEKKFIFRERPDIKLKLWADLFCTVHKDNGRIAMAWYITSLYRDYIYKLFKFFPHCFLFGPPGSGKSMVGWSVRAMGFVGVVKPFNLNTGTAVAFHREFAHFRNFPAWCDEYDNNIAYERIQALKAAYDGVGHKKSVKDSDKRTKATQVNRAVMISGQHLPIADNALFKRVILLQFNQMEFNEQEKKNLADLQEMEKDGLTHITAGFVHFRKLMEEKFLDTFDKVLKELMTKVAELQFDVEDRIARNNAMILCTIKILESVIPEMLPYSYEDLLKIVAANMKVQMGLITNTNETNSFWDMVEFLVREGKIKHSEDFVFDEKQIVKVIVNREDSLRDLGKMTEIVYIRFSKIIPLYREAFKRQNSSTSSPMDRGSLMHYLTHSKSYIGMISNINFKDSRTSAYAFDYGLLKAMGYNFGGSESHMPPPSQGNGTQPDVPLPGADDELPF
jgi:hypothetical protein